MILYFLFVLLFTLGEASERTRIRKQANKFAKDLTNKMMDVKINIEYIRKPVQYDFNVTNCPSSKTAQCVLCKEKVVEDEEFCDKPKTEIEKCLCLASNHHWRTMYENVEDRLQTVNEACSFVCENSTLKSQTTNVNQTGIKTTNNSNSLFILLLTILMIFIF
ncbi:hypothetical protein CL6EHI_168330 [Entamoeba histolytica]|uniref:Uncharacterized protein n=1 Tax=Entamoeba histolytica TaxID=5759 RepID=A0A175JSJ5_ENTHI|nr:hypothetical protein CL6EHI_168330 [Entamoeba histolytica]